MSIGEEHLKCSYMWGHNFWFRLTAAQRRLRLPWVRARLAGARDPSTKPEWCERFYHAAFMVNFAHCGSQQDLTEALVPWMTVALAPAETPPPSCLCFNVSEGGSKNFQLTTDFCTRLCEDIARYPGFQGQGADPRCSLWLTEWVVKTVLPSLGQHHQNPLLIVLCRMLVRNTGGGNTGRCERALLAFASGIIDSGISPNGIEGQESPLQIAQKAMDKFAQSPGAAEGQGPNGARFLAAARLKALLLEKGAKGGG